MCRLFWHTILISLSGNRKVRKTLEKGCVVCLEATLAQCDESPVFHFSCLFLASTVTVGLVRTKQIFSHLPPLFFQGKKKPPAAVSLRTREIEQKRKKRKTEKKALQNEGKFFFGRKRNYLCSSGIPSIRLRLKKCSEGICINLPRWGPKDI